MPYWSPVNAREAFSSMTSLLYAKFLPVDERMHRMRMLRAWWFHDAAVWSRLRLRYLIWRVTHRRSCQCLRRAYLSMLAPDEPRCPPLMPSCTIHCTDYE